MILKNRCKVDQLKTEASNLPFFIHEIKAIIPLAQMATKFSIIPPEAAESNLPSTTTREIMKLARVMKI